MSKTVEPNPSGVVVSGLYGAGKSTVVEEIASVLEEASTPYGALDLDWLWWFGVPGLSRSDALRVLFDNLASVADSYLHAGVTHFVMAWSLREPSDLAGLRTILPFPVRVVELVAPLSVIESRLAAAVTTGREDDLSEARRWHREGLGNGLGDVQVSSDRAVGEVATDILNWLGWK